MSSLQSLCSMRSVDQLDSSLDVADSDITYINQIVDEERWSWFVGSSCRKEDEVPRHRHPFDVCV